MPFDNNSLAKRLVKSTALPQNGSRPRPAAPLGDSSSSSLSQTLNSSGVPRSVQSMQPNAQSSSDIGRYGENNAEQQFLKWVNKLDQRTQSLESRIPSGDVVALEREANTCKAELQHLYDYAATQVISLEGCYNQLVGIRNRLQSIDLKLEKKKEKIEKSKRPTLIKVINVVLHAISIVADILGLAPLGGLFRSIQQALPSGKDIKLLE